MSLFQVKMVFQEKKWLVQLTLKQLHKGFSSRQPLYLICDTSALRILPILSPRLVKNLLPKEFIK